MSGMLTGEPSSGIFGGASVDQWIAQKLTSSAPFKSIELGVLTDIWGEVNQTRMSYSGPNTFVSPQQDPQAAFQRLFAGVASASTGASDAGAAMASVAARRKSVLDFVTSDASSLRARLGAGERYKLDSHLAAIRAVETSLFPAAGSAPDLRGMLKRDGAGLAGSDEHGELPRRRQSADGPRRAGHPMRPRAGREPSVVVHGEPRGLLVAEPQRGAPRPVARPERRLHHRRALVRAAVRVPRRADEDRRAPGRHARRVGEGARRFVASQRHQRAIRHGGAGRWLDPDRSPRGLRRRLPPPALVIDGASHGSGHQLARRRRAGLQGLFS